MGLTLLAFISAALLFLLAPAAFRQGRSQSSGVFIGLLDFFLALFSLFHGLVEVVGGPNAGGLGESPLGLVFSRLSFAALVLALAAMMVAALSFPSWMGVWSKALASVFVLASFYVVWFAVATQGYMTMIFRIPGGVVRFPGDSYTLLTDFMAGLAGAAAVTHLLRSIFTSDRIHAQRSSIAALGLALGIVAMWLFGRGAANVLNRAGTMDVLWTFYLLPIPALIIGGSMSYALFISRLFDWSFLARRTVAYTVLTLLFGIPAGAAVAALLIMGRISIWVPIVGSPLVFLLARTLAIGFAKARLERLSAREYREELESGLSHIDLSAGRDFVLGETRRLLAEAFDLVELSVLIEDERGVYKTVFSSSGRTGQVERGSQVHEVIEASGVTVLLRSEALTDPTFAPIKDQIIGFFDTFRGEAMVFAREGRHIIGAFVLGGRRSGGDYTDYDYDSFEAIYGKLFVIAYYLKNVARESIVYTVSRELALSDQVVRFALENVDRPDDPGVDTAWTMRSTRSLGGDFVDFVRISKRRWFFVLGDISGKGLSASMNMLILKSMIRTFLRIERDFTGLVQRVNAFIKDNLPKGTFFAGIFGYFDFERNALYFINCGVPALLLYSPASRPSSRSRARARSSASSGTSFPS